MRFDSVEYLQTWLATGEFPGIHSAMCDFVVKRAQGRRVLDLCCNMGLLGEQILSRMPGAYVIGVDGDERSIERGRRAGVRIEMVRMRIDPSTYDDLRDLMLEHRIDVVVARRCLPEILDAVPWSIGDFAQAIRDGGGREVFLQGRVQTPNPANRLPSIAHEMTALSSRYQHGETVGQLAYLVDDRVEPGRAALGTDRTIGQTESKAPTP